MTILDFYFREILLFFFQQFIKSSASIFCPDNSCFVLVMNYSNTIFTKWLVSILCNVTAYIFQSNQTTHSMALLRTSIKNPLYLMRNTSDPGAEHVQRPSLEKKFQTQLFKNSNELTIATWLYLPPGPPRRPIPGTRRLADLKNKILFPFLKIVTISPCAPSPLPGRSTQEER